MAQESRNSVSNTGKVYVDGILWGDKWYGGPVTYNFFVGAYYFNSDRDFIVDGYGDQWFTEEVTAVKRGLAAWAAVCDIKFQQTSNGSQDVAFYNDDLFGALGIADTPSSPTVEYNTVVFNWSDPSWTPAGLLKGGAAYETIVHEIGHAIGLAHPHDHGGGSPIFPGVNGAFDTGTYGMNQDLWTVMSYVSWSTHTGTPVSNFYGNIAGPMALDIAAVQRIYGANEDYKVGNNTYALPKADGAGAYYWCVWDAGGIDTISATGATADTTIDLRWAPLVGSHAGGYLSSVDGVTGGCTIARTRRSNGRAAAGDDDLGGNQFNNLLTGSGGEISCAAAAAMTPWAAAGTDVMLGGSAATCSTSLNL
jgi:serralysin